MYIYIHIIYIYIYHIYHISYIPNDIWIPWSKAARAKSPGASSSLCLGNLKTSTSTRSIGPCHGLPLAGLTVQEVWVESDFTKPPDYLPLGKMLMGWWGWRENECFWTCGEFFWCLLVEECGDVFFTCLEIDIIGNWEKRATVEWEYW